MTADESKTEVVVDLRDDPGGWLSQTCGLPNVVRALCALQHAGIDRATIVGDDAQQAIALFERHPLFLRDVYRGLRAAAAADMPEPSDAPTLVFRAPVVFSSATAKALAERAEPGHNDVPSELPDGVPGFLTAAGDASRAQAGKAIRAACRKPMLQSGMASVTVLQPIALVLNRAVCRAPITPNALTVVGFIVAIPALPLLWIGGWRNLVLAGVLLLINNILDQMDGQIARMKFLFSSFGDRLDHYLDEVTKVVILAPIGMGLFHTTGDEIWMILGWAGSGARLLYALTLAYYVRNFGDDKATTTNFRFWYRVPRDGAAPKPKKPKKPSKPGNPNAIKLRYFLRKDFIHTAYFAFALANWIEIPFVLAAFGAAEYGLISIIQLTLFHKRVGFQSQYQGDV